MARSQKAAAAAALKAQKAAEKAAEKEAIKAQKAAEKEAIKAQKAAQKAAVAAQREYEKQVRAAEREAIRAAAPKRPRGRPRKNPVTGSVASGSTATAFSGGGGYIDAPVLTPPPPGLLVRQEAGDLHARMAALEVAYADMNRRLQSMMTV